MLIESQLIAKSSGNFFLIFLPAFVFEAFFILKKRSLFFPTDKVPLPIIIVEFLISLIGLVVGISVFTQWQYSFIRWQQALILFSLVWTIFFLTLSFSDLRRNSRNN